MGNERGKFLPPIEIEYERRYVPGNMYKINSYFDILNFKGLIGKKMFR